jgi:hypothetical protein
VLTLLCRGHRLDPEQAVCHNIFSEFYCMIFRRPDLHDDIRSVWGKVRDHPSRLPGLMRDVARQVKRLKWKWIAPSKFQTASGTVIDLETMGQEEFLH